MSGPARIPPAYLALGVILYGMQGIVVAYFINFNKTYMMSYGLGLEPVSQVQTLALMPMVFKFLGAPFSDRFNLMGFGHRKPYIVLGVAAQTIGLAALARIDPESHLALFATMAVLTVAGLGLYDTCCDGMIVDVTPPDDRARAQGILWSARFASAMVFTLGFGSWLDRLGGVRHSDRVLLACAGLGLVPLTLAMILPDPARAPDAERFRWSALRGMTRPWSLALLVFGGLYGLIGVGVETNLSPYYGTLGFDSGGDVGLLGSSRYLGRAVGAVLLPVFLPRIGRRDGLIAGCLGLSGTIALQATAAGRPSAAVLALVFGMANGWCDALFSALAMEASDPRLAASTFALFMAVTNLSIVGDALFARTVVSIGGYRGALVLVAAVGLGTLALVPMLARPARDPESEAAHDPVA